MLRPEREKVEIHSSGERNSDIALLRFNDIPAIRAEATQMLKTRTNKAEKEFRRARY